METVDIPEQALHAYLQLIELNLGSWKPRVAAWLHSPEADAPLKELLAIVPCSPTLH